MPIPSFCLTVWIRWHAAIHRQNTAAYFSAAVQQECGLLKLSVPVKDLLERTGAHKLSPRARGHTAASQTDRAPVCRGQQLGLCPPTLLTFKDVIVCRSCRPHIAAIMACFSLWQPPRAYAARLIILIWSALLRNLSTHFPSFYSPVSLLSFFCIPLAYILLFDTPVWPKPVK